MSRILCATSSAAALRIMAAADSLTNRRMRWRWRVACAWKSSWQEGFMLDGNAAASLDNDTGGKTSRRYGHECAAG